MWTLPLFKKWFWGVQPENLVKQTYIYVVVSGCAVKDSRVSEEVMQVTNVTLEELSEILPAIERTKDTCGKLVHT